MMRGPHETARCLSCGEETGVHVKRYRVQTDWIRLHTVGYLCAQCGDASVSCWVKNREGKESVQSDA
jgi:transcription elongation factor Elf1